MRRPLPLFFASLLGLGLFFGLVSYFEAFALLWEGHALGACNGIAIYSHSATAHRSASLRFERSPGPNWKLPGEGFMGFHVFDSSAFRLIGIPLWFPVIASAAALAATYRAARRKTRISKGFDVQPDTRPPDKTPVPSLIDTQ